MVNKVEKYEDHEASSWWRTVSPMPSRRLAHRLVSDAIWFALLQAAHAHYFKFLFMNKRQLDLTIKYRQVHRARAYLEALSQIVHEMLKIGMLESKPEASIKLNEYQSAADQACREAENDENA